MDDIQSLADPVLEFDGVVILDGESIPVLEVDRVLEATASHLFDSEARNAFRWRCGKACELRGLLAPAYRYVEAVQAGLPEGDENHLAACILAKGCIHEKLGDYRTATDTYRTAFDLSIRKNETWYFLFNNLGYSLIRINRHIEAEDYCRVAITLAPRWHNAHRNLGLALEGQERFIEAADSFIRASVCCPGDGRALARLRAMLERVPEVGQASPEIVTWSCTQRLETEPPRGSA